MTGGVLITDPNTNNMSNPLSKEYDLIYAKETRHYNKHYSQSPYLKIWERVASHIKPHHSVVDIGCGTGQVMELLLDKGVQRYTGYEFSKVAIDKANSILSGRNDKDKAEIIYQDLYELKELVEADFYISIEVMEHLIDDKKVISYIPKGKNVIITVPNYLGGSHVRKFDNEQQVIDRYKYVINIAQVVRMNYGSGLIFVMGGVKA